MKRKKEFLSTVMIVSLLFTHIIFAMNTAEILVRYREVNPSYKKIVVQNQMNVAALDQYDTSILILGEQEENISNNISAAEAQYEAFEEEGNVIGMLNLQYQIENLNSQLTEVRKKLASSTLQKNIAKYDAIYADEIVDMQQKKIEYEFLKQYYMIPVQQKGVKFSEDRIDQLESLITAEEVKLNFGYTTEVSVNLLKLQLEQAENEMYLLEDQLQLSENFVEKNTYYSDNIVASLEHTISEKYEIESCIAEFLEKNPRCEQYENQMDAYATYIATLSEIPETDAEQKIAQLQKNSLELDLEQYKINLPLYVEEKIMEYENYKRLFYTKDFEISVCKDKIKQLEELYQKGKVKQTDLWSQELELAKLKFEEENIRYQMRLLQFLLENQVE